MDIEKIIREYIDKSIHLSLATSRDGQPWVCEVHFAYDDDLNLYFRSLPNRRHSLELIDNPRVAGNIVRQHKLGEPPKAIYFEGTARQLTDVAEQRVAAEWTDKCLKSGMDILRQAEDPNAHQFYKISVTKYYAFGEFEGQKTAKYELAWNRA